VGKSPIPNNCGSANKASSCCAPKKIATRLLGPRTPTLDQDNQNDNNEHTGNNPDNRVISHSNSSFPH
jgi:hypothetical protein